MKHCADLAKDGEPGLMKDARTQIVVEIVAKRLQVLAVSRQSD